MSKINRREFIKLSVTGSAFLAIGYGVPVTVSANSSADKNSNFSSNIWLKIDQNNMCTLTVSESEIGQGVFTGIATLIAEELDLNWSDVKVERASSSGVYGYQSTGGSTSIRKGWDKFREVGAMARQMLLQAASKKWAVPVENCYTKNSMVYDRKSNKSIKYSALIDIANELQIPTSFILKKPQQYNLIGKKTTRLDSLDKVTGSAEFGLDVQLPDMLYATTVHAPVFGASFEKVDDREALLVDGVVKVLEIDNAVAVIANNTWSALKAAKLLKIDWRFEGKLVNSEKIKQQLVQALKKPATLASEKGQVSFDKTQSIISAVYSAPFQAHATMEPMNCTVHIHDGVCEVWAPTQSPSKARSMAKRYYHSSIDRLLVKARSLLKIEEAEDVIINTTYSGGGFGRRLKQDYVGEAVQIALHFSQPIKLLWSREEDMQHDYYRPIAYSELKASLDKDGYPASIEHHLVSPSLRESMWPGSLQKKKGIDKITLEGATNLAYDIDNHKVLYTHVKTPVPLGFWRSVGASINAYHIECFVDELAHKAAIDPLEYRHEMLHLNPRLQQTLIRVKEISEWKKQADAYYGVACHSSYGSHVSQVVKLNKVNGQLKIEHIYCVIDCGIFVNPDIVKAQLEGSIIFGLSSLSSEINIKEGRVVQSNFHDFPLLSFNQSPPISCEILNSSEEPGGAGEPGVPPAIPAVLNAVFAATGKRIRDLPVSLSGIKL